MKFKIKKQLLNEANAESPQIPLFGNSPGAEKIKDQLGNVLSYNEDREAFDSPPIRDAIIVKNFLKTADDEVAGTLTTKFSDLNQAINKVINDYKAAKRTAATAKTAADDAAANKEKEAQQAPKKKALMILAHFALDTAGLNLAPLDDAGDETKFLHNNEKLKKNLDIVKKALNMVEGGDSELDLRETKLYKTKILKESADKAEEFANTALTNLNILKKIVQIIKKRIEKIEQEKTDADKDEATKKQEEEQRKKEVSELITVCSFFHDKVGFDKYYSRKIIRYALNTATFGLVDSEETKIRKKFPNIDMYLKWIGDNLQNFSEEKIIQKYGPPSGGGAATNLEVFEEMKKIRGRILTKYTPTFKAISAIFGNIIYNGKQIKAFIGTDGDDISTFLGTDKIQPLQESKKYKLKLIENKRG